MQSPQRGATGKQTRGAMAVSEAHRGPHPSGQEAVLEDTVIVIDALDECDDGEAFRLFLETLLKLAPDLPFKIFLTSRPEPVI